MTLVSSPLPLALRASTLCEAFVRTAAERPGDVALRTPRDLRVLTWAEYTERVERIAAGLQALGVERGDTVALMLLNRPEFHLVDTAALHAGAIPFSVYNTSSLEQANEIFENARPVVAVTERALLPLVAAAARAQPTLRHVVLIDGREHNAMSLEELEERGSSGLDLRAAARATHPATWPRSSTPRARAGRRRAWSSRTPTCSPRPAPRRSASRSSRPAGSSPTCPRRTSSTAGRATTTARSASAARSPAWPTRGRCSPCFPTRGPRSGAASRACWRSCARRSSGAGSTTRAR